jgi:DNA-binding transcriptional LysR family regulator
MDVDELTVFVEVMRRRSFSAVAQDRGVAPSSISRAIDALERRLGARLFQRTTRRVSPTEAGVAYFERIEPVVEELARASMAIEDMAGRPRGTLRVTVSVSFGLTRIAPLLADFVEAYPDLQLEMIFTDAVVDLAAERIDVAIRHGPLADSSLVARKLLPVAYVLCASPAYLARHGTPATPADLAQHRCLGFSTTATRARWRLQKRAEADEVVVHPRIVMNNGIALRRCAVDGGGLVLLSDWLVDDALRSGALVRALPGHDATPTEFDSALWLVYPSRAYVPRKVGVFVEFLEGALTTDAHR